MRPGPQRRGDRQPGREDHLSGRSRARLRRSEAPRWAKAPHPGGYGRTGVGREGPRCGTSPTGKAEGGVLSEEQGLSRLELLWANGAYTGGFREWLRRRFGWRVEVPHHPDRQLWRYGLEEKPRGFQVLPRRWVVERTFAWLSLLRCFSKDYERLPE